MSTDFEDIEIVLDPANPGSPWLIGELSWADWGDLCDLIADDLGRVVEFTVDPHVLDAADAAWHKAWSESYGMNSAEASEAYGAWRRAFPDHSVFVDALEPPEYTARMGTGRAAYREACRAAYGRHVERMVSVNRAWLDTIGIPALTWAHEEAGVGIETLRRVVDCMPFKLDIGSAEWLNFNRSGEFCELFVRVVAGAWKAGVLG